MIGELITLPLRATGLAARLWWRSAERTLNLASDVVGYVAARAAGGSYDERSVDLPADAPSASSASPVPAPSPSHAALRANVTEPLPPQPTTRRRVEEPQPVPPAEEPTHVSEEPELVAEFAESGVEDGAGPELHIREPWDGYRDMSARQVTARLGDASTAELAAVQLFESSTRSRQTILSAVARQLRSANGNGSRA